jgi:lipopolysaccharide transport system ATP-binding protein
MSSENKNKIPGDKAIRVQSLSKCYQIYDKPHDRLKQSLYPSLQRLIGKPAKQYHREFWALRDVSFEIKRGETIGIIGRNGSGKSTLLQMICGTLAPTSGTVETNGRVAALLELGSGFNPEFTGRENVYMNGAVLGLTTEEIDERFDAIASFADIGQFIDQPVKTYSNGMSVRLAFAVQSQLDPDILIIDEALSVGDFFFQQKCFSYIRGLCDKGVTLLFVSHDMGTVRDICGRAIYLKEGQSQFVGQTQTAIRQFLAEKNASAGHTSYATDAVETAKAQEFQAILRDRIWAAAPDASGENTGRLIAVAFYDNEGKCSTSFRMCGVMCIKVVYCPAIGKPNHVSIEVRNKFNQVVTSLGSSRMGLMPPQHQQGQLMLFEISIDLLVEAGNYSVTVNLGQIVAPNQGQNLDASPPLGPISVHWDYERERAPFLGMVGLSSQGAFKLLEVGAAQSHADLTKT